MKEALVVVHIDEYYLNPRGAHADSIVEHARFFEKVAHFASAYRGPMYALEEMQGIHATLACLNPRHISCEHGLEHQYLAAKEQLLADHIERVDVIGQYRDCCIRDFCAVLQMRCKRDALRALSRASGFNVQPPTWNPALLARPIGVNIIDAYVR